MVTSDGLWTTARQIRLFITRLSHHQLSLSPPPPIIDQQHRHCWQQWQVPIALALRTPQVSYPAKPDRTWLPHHQHWWAPAHYPPTATSSTLTSASEPDNECWAPNACPLPRHLLTAMSLGLTSAGKPKQQRQLPSSQHLPTATVNDNKPRSPPTYSTTKCLENGVDGSECPWLRGGDGPEREQQWGQMKEGPGKHPQPTTPTLPDCWLPTCMPWPSPCLRTHGSAWTMTTMTTRQQWQRRSVNNDADALTTTTTR